MKKRKVKILVLLFAAILLILGSRFWLKLPFKQPPILKTSITSNVASSPINYTAHILKNNFPPPALLELKKGVLPVAGITSHHLPTAEEFIETFYRELAAAKPDVKNFLIVGPDHFEQCRNLGSVTNKDFLTAFGLLENNHDVSEALLNSGAGEDNRCFENEHSIGVQTTFIKKYFPNAKAAGLMFSSAAGTDLAEKLATTIKQKYPETIVIASTDFSHYQSLKKANAIDSGTQKQIENLQTNNILLEQVDSPASLRFVLSYASAFEADFKWIKHANSYDFTGNPDNTTGYFNVIFGREP